MEKLMRKCLDSILAQSFTDYECLLIDDGSTDSSLTICDEYVAKDNRFKAFHKPNGGLSDARNYGINKAQGEYTIFFDPDDWVDQDCLMDMYANAQETDADMVMCDLYYNDPFRERYCKQEPTSLDHNDVLKDLIIGKVYGFTVTKLIRRSLYHQYQLEYPKDMYGCEDQYTMCNLLKSNIKIAYLPKAYYHYMFNNNQSLSRKYKEDTLLMDMKTRDMFVELLEDTDLKDLAYQCKTVSMVNRAFMYGNKLYSSKRYCEVFGEYKSIVLNNTEGYMALFQRMSFCGMYQLSRKLFGLLFFLKQIYKKHLN
jgi:glycosyltransferase involved in cell wall biosynthesis